MTEKTNSERQEAGTATGTNPMADMCGEFMSKWASGCGPKGFKPPSCFPQGEISTETKSGEQAAEGEASS